MEKLQFSTTIQAPKQKVWESLWEDANYRKWTNAFCEGSYAITDWKEGSKALFLSPGNSGMVSKIAVNRPFEFMSIEHLGEVKNGVEDVSSDKVKEWAGAHENYTLTENDGVTTVLIEMDSVDSFKDYLVNTWPKALEQLKALAEQPAS